MPAAVALQVINIITRDALACRAIEAGRMLHAGLCDLMDIYSCIGDVRGRGLLLGMEIVCNRKNKDSAPDLAEALVISMLELGLSVHLATFPNGGRAFRIAPALIISNDEIDQGHRIMDDAFQRVTGIR